MVWSVLQRLTPTQPMVMQSDAIREREGPQGLISTYTLLFSASWNESTALYQFISCLCVHECVCVCAKNFSHNS